MLEAAAILARLDAIMRELAELRAEVAADGAFPQSAAATMAPARRRGRLPAALDAVPK